MNDVMESNQLLIRESAFEDCNLFAEWENNPEVARYFSIDEERCYPEIVEEYILRKATGQTHLQFTIVYKEKKQPIGRIWISRLDRHADSLDITRIYIGEDAYRGKGHGEASLKLLLEYCFKNLHMERVTLDHFSGNQRASNLYQKLGFQYEGILRNACKKDGRYYDLHAMAMLRAEYFTRHNEED